MTQQDTQPPAETLAERDVARQHAHALLDDALFRCSQGKAKADFIEALHKHDQEQGLSYDGIVELCQTWVWAIIAQGPAAALTRRAGGDAIPAGALPQHIGRVHLGERRSDGERLCSHGHEVPAGHPLYWPEQISQYDDSDPLCLAHAIEQLECDNADWNTPKPPAGGDTGDGFIVKLDNWMTISVEDGDMILRNEAGEPIAFGKLGPNADFPAGAAHEPFGHWVEQKHADPVLLRKPSYIPEPSDLRTVTPLYSAALALPAPVVEGDSPYVAGPIWAEEEDDCFTAEIQISGGHYVVATVHGATRDQVEQRQRAIIAALSEGRSHG